MKPDPMLLILAGALALAGCKPQTSASGQTHHGRYVGIGLYFPGEGWKRIVDAAQSKLAGKAGPADDEQVIVVVDSDTGEIRQCGALSGYCVGMKPWDQGVSQSLPVSLGPPPQAQSAVK